MKTSRFNPYRTVILSLPVALALIGTSEAVVRTKAASGSDLTVGASWDTLPGSGDVATWATGSLGGALTIGSNISWQGIDIQAATAAITTSGAGVLTLGSSGVNIATGGVDVILDNSLTIGADQNWTVGSGRTLTASRGKTLTLSNKLTLNGAGQVNFGGTGATTLTGAGEIVVSSGTLQNNMQTGSLATGRTGATTLSGGTISIASSISMFGSGAINLNGGAIGSSNATGRDFGTGNAVSIGGNVQIGGASGGLSSGYVRFGGATDLGGSVRTITAIASGVFSGNGAGAIFNGKISNGGITKEGSGYLTLGNNTNDFTGAVTINAGNLAFSSKALASASSVTLANSGVWLVIGENGAGVTHDVKNLNGVAGSIIRSDFSISGTSTARILKISQTVDGTYAGQILHNAARPISLLKEGSASLTLSGSTSDYQGGTTLSQGTLVAANSSALGAGGTVAINDANTGSNNTTLNIDATGGAVTIARAITVANQGTGTVTLGNATTSGTNAAIFSGAITLNKDVTLNGGAAGDRFSTTGGIGGTGNLTISGTNRVLFGGTANSYAGSTTINSNSILQLSDGTLTAASFLPDAYNVTVNSGGVLKLAKGGRVESIGGLAGTGTVEAISGADTIAVGGGDATSSFSGILRDNGGSLSLTKTGTGTQTLTGTSSYTGQTSISNGTLSINSLADYGTDSSLGKGTAGNPIVIGSDTASGVLEYTGSGATTNRTIRIGRTDAGATGSGTIKNNGTGALVFSETGNFTSVNVNGDSNRTLTLGGSNSGANEIKGVIRDFNGATATTGVIKADGGVWVLSGANTYTGSTSVTGGKLVINGSISTSALTTVDNGASLGGSGTVGALTVNGTLAPGNSIESIGTGNLSFGSTSTYAYELQTDLYGTTPGVAGDLAFAGGTLGITGGATLTLADLGTITALANGSKLTLISYVGAWNNGLFTYLGNSLADDSTFTLGLNEWKFDYNDASGGPNFSANQTGATGFVTMTVVPEPGSALLGGLGVLALLRRRRQA